MDHIETYLTSELVTSEAISEAGGYMMYWNTAKSNRPCVAKFGMDFCSAPGKYYTCFLSVLIPDLFLSNSNLC